MVSKWRNCIVAFACLLASSAAFPHHGVSLYDFTKRVDIEGRVVEASWKNPHVYLVIEASGTQGETRRIRVEGASLSVIRASGLQDEMLPVGSPVRITAAQRVGNPDSNDVFGLAVTLDDGSAYRIAYAPGPAPTVQSVPATGLAGNWIPESPTQFGEYMQAEGRAQATLARASTQDKDPAFDTCARLARLPVPFATAALGGLRTIETRVDSVVMRIDADGYELERIIDFSVSAHPTSIESSPLGHSIGRWEGETLVIDTIAFEPNSEFHQGQRKHMVERLMLLDDRRQLRYEFVVDDPDYYAEPFRYSMLWSHRPDLQPSGAECDDDSARRYLSLE